MSLGQQRSGLERALPAANDYDGTGSEPPQVPMFRCVRNQCGRQSVEWRWTVREWRDAGGNNHAGGSDALAVLK